MFKWDTSKKRKKSITKLQYSPKHSEQTLQVGNPLWLQAVHAPRPDLKTWKVSIGDGKSIEKQRVFFGGEHLETEMLPRWFFLCLKTNNLPSSRLFGGAW